MRGTDSLTRLSLPTMNGNGIQRIKELWFKSLGQIGYRRACVREFLLDQPFTPPPARIPLEFDLLDSATIDEYNAFRRGVDRDAARRQLEAGHRCFLARS